MNKVWMGITIAALALATGTAVYAAADDDGGFRQMLPLMKQMHPDSSEQQLREMYSNCRGNGQDMSEMMKTGMMGGMTNSMMNGGSMPMDDRTGDSTAAIP